MPQGPLPSDRDQRHAALGAIVLLGFGLIMAGLIRLQILEHDQLTRLAEQNRIRLDILRAPRGDIRDRSGRLLADSQPSFDILFRPLPAESLTRARATIDPAWLTRIAALVQDDTAAVRRRVREANRSGQTAVLRRAAPYGVMAAVEEFRSDLPGIDVQVSPIRHYPEGMLAAQLLGYAGQINDGELAKRTDRGYRMGDLIGKNGLERRYEDVLRGVDGAEFVVVNAMGKRVATLSEGPPRLPVPGHGLTLTIDLDIQRALEEAMVNIERGAGVVLDPRDGGVLAMVSKPAFDPNEFSVGISSARWKDLNRDGAYPLLNRAIQSAYPPGSTFKIVTMMAGLRDDLIDGDTRFPVGCAGGYFFGGRRFGCWLKTGHGNLDTRAALQHSCDVYFYQLGLKLGLERLETTARAMGLGEKTGIDLPAETRGLVPDEAWYDKRFKRGTWPRGVLLNLGIGQGELLASPLQLATMTAIAANGGRPVRPHVVREVVGVPTFKVDKPIESGIQTEPADWNVVHEAMRLVVDAGTARASRVEGIGVAGKTGTAQNPHGNDHALYVAYAPYDAPRLALAIVAENSGHGGSVAAPIAGHVLRRVLLGDSTHVAPRPPQRGSAPADSIEAIGD